MEADKSARIRRFPSKSVQNDSMVAIEELPRGAQPPTERYWITGFFGGSMRIAHKPLNTSFTHTRPLW